MCVILLRQHETETSMHNHTYIHTSSLLGRPLQHCPHSRTRRLLMANTAMETSKQSYRSRSSQSAAAPELPSKTCRKDVRMVKSDEVSSSESQPPLKRAWICLRRIPATLGRLPTPTCKHIWLHTLPAAVSAEKDITSAHSDSVAGCAHVLRLSGAALLFFCTSDLRENAASWLCP